MTAVINAGEKPSAWQRLRGYAAKNWLALFSAFVIGLGFPLYKLLVIDRASLHVEITGLDVSAPDAPLNWDSPSLKSTAEFFQNGDVFIDPSDLKVERLIRFVTNRRKNLETQTSKVAEQKQRLQVISAKVLTPSGLRSFVADLSNAAQRQISVLLPADNNPLAADKQKVLVDVISQTLEDASTQLSADSKKVDTVSAELEQYKTNLQSQAANVLVECGVSNTGGGAISLKQQGLLRVSLGGANYLDIQLRMLEPEKGADLQAKNSKVIKLASDPLQNLGGPERERIINYFKQSAPAELWLQDIRGNTFHSNVVPFAKGLYEQATYDALRMAATKRGRGSLLAGILAGE